MEKKEIKCPICGRGRFSFENSFEICNYCGWENDGIQAEDPDYEGGANEVSLNVYKKRYLEIIKNNPKYKWSKDNK